VGNRQYFSDILTAAAQNLCYFRKLTFVDEAESGRKSGAVGAPVVSMKLDDKTSLGRVEATLSTSQSATQLNARRLRLADLRTLQIQEQPDVVSTPGM